MRKAIYDTNKPVKYCTIPEASERYRLSRFLLLKILDGTDAIKHFGKSVRVDITVADKLLDAYGSSKNE